MLLHNIKLTVTDITTDGVLLESELKQKIIIAKDFLEKAKIGDTIYLAADVNPLSITSAKDILNEMIDGQDQDTNDQL